MRNSNRRNLLWIIVAASCCSLVLIVIQQHDVSVQTSEVLANVSKPSTAGCSPATKIVFLKVHKAGSSTVANIMQRFGFTRNLNFVIPAKMNRTFQYNYIGKRGETVSKDKIFPPPHGETFDILWNHVTYNYDAFNKIMPENTRYVSILRDPFDQFVSAFEYYYRRRLLSNMTTSKDFIAGYLEDADTFKFTPLTGYLRNSQAWDLGFSPQMLKNQTLEDEYMTKISEDFDLVMLMEYFNESLVLLKRTLCWDLKDILYFRHNSNQHKQTRHFQTEHYEKHRHFSAGDYHLYEHFRSLFWDKIWAEGPEFFDEVRYFKQLLQQLRDYCLLGWTLVVPESEWNSQFQVNRQDCVYLQMPELTFYEKIRESAFAKLNITQISNVFTTHKAH